MKLMMELYPHDVESIHVLAAALGFNPDVRGVKPKLVRIALHFAAAKFATPCCPDCGTDLVPVLDEQQQPTGRWFCRDAWSNYCPHATQI